MSRFWAGVASSSSESGSSSDDSSTDSSVSPQKKQWLDDSSDYSDSEDGGREAKSAKDRTFESLENSVKSIRNAMKIRDYSSIQTNFSTLMKTISSNKTKSIIDAHGGLPRFFIKTLVELDDFVIERKKDKAAFKKLSPSQGRSLNRMGLTMRKTTKVYKKLMDEYRANPGDSSSSEEEDDDDSDSDSDSDSEVATKKQAAVVSSDDSDSDSDSDSSESDSDESDSEDSDSDGDSDEDDSDDSENWDSSSESSSSSDSEAEDGAYSELKGRARWLKKNTIVKVKKIVSKEEKKIREEERRLKKEAEREERLTREAEQKGDIIKEDELTAAVLEKKMKELVSSRGRRGTDAKVILKKLETLSKLSTRFGPRIEVPILMHVVTAQFDLVRSLDDYMDMTTWKSCLVYLNRIAGILENDEEKDDSKKYRLGGGIEDNELMVGNVLAKATENKMKDAANVGEMGAMDAVAADVKLVNPHTGEPETEDQRAERIRVEKEANMTEEELLTIPVIGSLSLFLSRLDEEYIKSLQRTSSYSLDYIIRLRDEGALVELMKKLQSYFERVESKAEAAEMALLQVEHLYYRHDSIAHKVREEEKQQQQRGDEKKEEDVDLPEEDSQELLNDLCSYVYQHGTDRSKTRAMMCHIYHHALHDRFLEARDLLLMSHLQDNITNVGDVTTMILFNRMMVTVGLCAFRIGKIWDAHQCLTEICSERPRELLAQGMTGSFHHRQEKSPEQEKAEKRRQIPYHQHINQDLMEASHLISAMLLEVPNMAAHGNDNNTRRARVISRRFRKNHDQYNRQVFTGPPEQTKDFVMRAANELMKGEWKTCADLIVNLDAWKLVPGENAREQIQAVLIKEIKLAGLRTYLFAYSAQYDSLSLVQLCGMFDMSKNEVHSVVSKMMINRELHASWDQPTETIVLHNIEPSTLQLLALQYAEKTSNLVDSNERLLDVKVGNYGHRDNDKNWKSGDQRGHHNYQRRGNMSSGGGRGGSYRGGRGGGRGRGRGRGGRSRNTW